MATRKVIAEGSGKPVSRLVKLHHEARVAIVLGDYQGAPELILTESGYGNYRLVLRNYDDGQQVQVLAEGAWND